MAPKLKVSISHRRTKSTSNVTSSQSKEAIAIVREANSTLMREKWLQKKLTKAKQIAEKSVEYDIQLRYKDALLNYRELVDSFDKILLKLNIASRRGEKMDQEIVNQIILKKKMYQDRVTVLLDHLPLDLTLSYCDFNPAVRMPIQDNLNSFSATTYHDIFLSSLNIVKERVWVPISPNPQEAIFQFLAKVANSIWKGDFIAPDLFIPPYIWNQPGVRLLGIETKTSELGNLLSPLQRLKSYQDSDPTIKNVIFFDREMEEFEANMERARQAFAKKFKYAEESDTNSTLRSLSSRFQKSLDVFKQTRKDLEPLAHYRTTLASFLSISVDIFLKWLEFCRTSNSTAVHVRTRLQRTITFYQHVIFNLVTSDLQILLDKFIKKMRKEASG